MPNAAVLPRFWHEMTECNASVFAPGPTVRPRDSGGSSLCRHLTTAAGLALAPAMAQLSGAGVSDKSLQAERRFFGKLDLSGKLFGG